MLKTFWLPLALAGIVLAAGCGASKGAGASSGTQTDDAGSNGADVALPLRSVVVDNSACYVKGNGIDESTPCPNATTPANALLGTQLRGVNGAPKVVFAGDDSAGLLTNFDEQSFGTRRIPVGYGCAASLRGIWKGGPTGDVNNIANYDFSAFEPILASARTENSSVLWTAAYDLGDGGPCTYVNGEQAGVPIADPVRWAKVVRMIMKHYDRDAPTAAAATPACKTDPGSALPWNCFPSLFNVEYGRDPFGAGGYKNTAEDKAKWLEAYKQLSSEVRQEFYLPGNDVQLVAPSIVLNGDPTNVNGDDPANRSPIYDFIDYVVANQLPLTGLSMEVEACTPVEARSIVQAVVKYAAKKGLRYEKNFSNEDGSGGVSDGGQPIPIWVTDLRLNCKLAPEIESSASRKSAYMGAFYAGSKFLWQGLVNHAMVGTGPRFPAQDAAVTPAAQLLQTAHDSDYLWFGVKDPANALLKPAAWHQFWFNFMSGYARLPQVRVQEGPDALGLSGTVDSRRDSGILLMATRETCTDAAGKLTECVPYAPTDGAIRGHWLHVYVVDMDMTQSDAAAGTANPGHSLQIAVQGLPLDVTTALVQVAYVDGTENTWCHGSSTISNPLACVYEFIFMAPVPVSNGKVTITRQVAVPSMLYLQLAY